MRVAEKTLIQTLPDNSGVVFSDESSGQEVVVPMEAIGRTIGALQYVYGVGQ